MKLRVAVSTIRLGLSVAAQRLGVIATAIRLGLAVPAMRLRTVVGEFIKFLQFSDTVSATSSTQTDIGKPLSDVGRVVETRVEVEVRKPFSDGAGSDDDAQYFAEDYVVGAPGGQTYTIPKQIVLILSKPRSDSFSAAELARLLVASSRVETVRASDVRGGFLVIKAIQDGVGIDDELNGSGSGLLFKGFNTIPRALDLHAMLLQRGVGDTARAIDAPALLSGKVVGDTPRASDLRSLTSGKVFGDTPRVSEADVFLVGKSLAEVPRARDSGAIFTQDYVDSSTYFAEAYVANVSRTF